jgi:phenylacetate-CoA ligase
MSIDFRPQDYSYPLSILKLRRFFEKSQYFSPQKMEAYQQKRLRVILGQASRNIPYYSSLFKNLDIDLNELSSLSALKSLPFLNKEDLRRNHKQLQAKNADRFKPQEERSSGSTGVPCRFLLDRISRTLEFVFYWRHWSWAGYKLRDRFAELSSHYFGQAPERMDLIFSANPLTGRILLNSLKISPDNVLSFVEVLRRYRPKFLKGVASALYFFAYWLRQKSIDDIAFLAIFSTGETLTPQYRDLLENVFHCKVLDTYGHMERTVAVTQCLEGGYHVNSDYGFMELVDAGQSEKKNGQIGSVVGTSLYNMAMPLIRYQVGDLIESFPSPPKCSCGRTLPLIKAIHGRQEDVIVTPDNRTITSIYITLNLVKGFSFGQFIQEKKNSLRVNLIKNSDFNKNDELEFQRILKNFIGPDMNVELTYITAKQIVRDTSGKIPIVKSLIKPERWS